MKDEDRKRLYEIMGRLAAVQLDASGAEFTFSQRLARDNAWSQTFADRMVFEYRRFYALAALGLHPVTPSDEVDQAWHLHLIYSRHYWGEWMDALGCELHHGPTPGGEAAGNRYRDNYEATLASYRDGFVKAPPSDIWPNSVERFRDPSRYIRLDVSRYWFFKKWGSHDR